MAGLEGLEPYYDLVIVGAGLSGAVFAEQAASRFGLTSLIIDKRDHIGARPRGVWAQGPCARREEQEERRDPVRGSGSTEFLCALRCPCAGGNCYDFIDKHGIRVSQYGVHLFHTQARRFYVSTPAQVPVASRAHSAAAEPARLGVRQQVERVDAIRAPVRFPPRTPRLATAACSPSVFRAALPPSSGSSCSRHTQLCVSALTLKPRSVKGRVDGKIVPIPPSQETVNTLFGANVHSEEEMEAWLAARRVVNPSPANGEEAALSKAGEELYEKIFKHYTYKQWAKYPAELDASVLLRIPVRTNTDDRYFTDPWQAIPSAGYTRIFENMLLGKAGITIRTGVDFFAVKEQLPRCGLLVYTGPIDAYYASLGMPKLEYRSLRFEEEYHEPQGGYYQEALQVNYPGCEVPYTRIVEYKHKPNQPPGVHELPGTVVFKEYSVDEGDPYYPVPTPLNQALFERYKDLAAKEPGVCFVGRLASYKYFNMDQAILNALEIFDGLVQDGTLAPKQGFTAQPGAAA